ncbi:MAG: SMC-Scp complex subunit ScpB [Planctomycetaceae bacterium]|jgi:segregation and condensation protein B|nr:SMC-Scp complex subunit ScpB [Planctomycetaceae bacterium]
MVEKKIRKKKNELSGFEKKPVTFPTTLPAVESDHLSDHLEMQQRLGAVAFVEHIDSDEYEEDTDILSLETLRNAFANLSENNRNDKHEEESETEEFLSYQPDDGSPETETISEIETELESEHTVDLNPRTILEAMLFVGNWDNRPLSAFRAAEKMRNVSPEEIDEVVIALNRDYRQLGCPYTILKESDGYRMVLRPEFDPILAKFYGKIREAKLSQQAIDTLAVVAYRQPISTDDVQKIRRQPSSALLNQLVRRGLLGVEREIRDKKKIMLYRTTDRFLELFQLDSIDDLPVAGEIDLTQRF